MLAVTDGASLGRLLATDAFFFGFDEVWLCERMPEGGLPPTLSIPTSELLVQDPPRRRT